MLRKKIETSVAQSQTNQSVVASVSGRRVRVIGCTLTAGATATAITFNTLVAGTAVSATYTVPANSPISLPIDDSGHGDSAVGEGLGVTSGAGSTVYIDLTYQLI